MKRSLASCLIAVAATVACGGPPTAPSADNLTPTLTPVSAPGSQIVFSGITGGSVTTYTEAGYTVVASGAKWQGLTTYGNPAPFIQFTSQPGETQEGRLDITAGGATFVFKSVDLYASIIPIPYTITGLRGGATIFTGGGTVPLTFGRFATVFSPDTGTPIDTLQIRLKNTGPACCSNPMGVDNVIFSQ